MQAIQPGVSGCLKCQGVGETAAARICHRCWNMTRGQPSHMRGSSQNEVLHTLCNVPDSRVSGHREGVQKTTLSRSLRMQGVKHVTCELPVPHVWQLDSELPRHLGDDVTSLGGQTDNKISSSAPLAALAPQWTFEYIYSKGQTPQGLS